MIKHARILIYEWIAAFHSANSNDRDASKYLAKAACLGSRIAQNQLGATYLRGVGVQQSPRLAASWFESAAKQGDCYGQANLADLYRRGDGVKKDLAVAHSLYLAAASQGHATSQYNVALMYLYGEGTKLDKAAAVYWLRKAASQKLDAAERTLRQLVDPMKGVSGACESKPLFGPDDARFDDNRGNNYERTKAREPDNRSSVGVAGTMLSKMNRLEHTKMFTQQLVGLPTYIASIVFGESLFHNMLLSLLCLLIGAACYTAISKFFLKGGAFLVSRVMLLVTGQLIVWALIFCSPSMLLRLWG